MAVADRPIDDDRNLDQSDDVILTNVSQLFIRSDLPLDDVAKTISKFALRDFQFHLREGLNLGGGGYYKFFDDVTEILLVCNDEEHAEVFIEAEKEFPFYCYSRKGDVDLLRKIQSDLSTQGVKCELRDVDEY